MKVLVKEDCYFFIDQNIPEEERPISVLCKKCHESKQVGWFWEGSKRGYGIYDIMCSDCKQYVYKIERHGDI